MIVSLPQLLALNSTGAMKSLISDVNEVDERDFTYTDPKVLHAFFCTIPAQVRLIAASPNCCAGRSTAGLPPRFSETVAELVCASSHAPEMVWPVPQSLPFQTYLVSVGVFDPPWKA